MCFNSLRGWIMSKKFVILSNLCYNQGFHSGSIIYHHSFSWNRNRNTVWKPLKWGNNRHQIKINSIIEKFTGSSFCQKLQNYNLSPYISLLTPCVWNKKKLIIMVDSCQYGLYLLQQESHTCQNIPLSLFRCSPPTSLLPLACFLTWFYPFPYWSAQLSLVPTDSYTIT
jgi:hypothetical protein